MGATPEGAGRVEPPPRPPQAREVIESKLIVCERCGAVVAMLIFAPAAADPGRFEGYARKMYPQYTRLDVPTWQARVTNLLQCRELLTYLHQVPLTPAEKQAARAAVRRLYLRRHQRTLVRGYRKLSQIVQSSVRPSDRSSGEDSPPTRPEPATTGVAGTATRTDRRRPGQR